MDCYDVHHIISVIGKEWRKMSPKNQKKYITFSLVWTPSIFYLLLSINSTNLAKDSLHTFPPLRSNVSEVYLGKKLHQNEAIDTNIALKET